MSTPVLSAQTDVKVSAEEAREWFLSLEDHPERYRFDTHEGFEFVEGGFGEIGARFQTREEFLLLNLKLLFELTDVRGAEFRFRLIRPLSMGVWGRFRIEEDGPGETRVSLHIGSETRVGRLMLSSFPVATLVRRQIRHEVSHIKRSMEKTSSN